MRRAFAILVAFAAATAAAEPLLKARVIAPSPGMASDDLILCTADATEYGADKTGSADSTEAIQRALDACAKATGGIVFLPAGRYRVDGRLVVKGGVTLRGEWVNPEQGGVGKGTILMAWLGRGNESPTDQAFLRVHGASCLRDLSVWYPEQSPSDPVPYPATIHASGHSTIYNITLYNSWTGFWNNDCSSMLIRRLYGTVLKLGVHGAYAYDVPRIEHVHFSPRFWAESRLPGAPAGSSLAKLKAFLAQHLVGIQGGEQDWGYWWDLDIDWCARGLYLTAIPSDDGKKLVPGNICAGNVKIRNATVGIHVENAGYPGFMLTYGDISARTCGLYFANKPDYVARYGEVGEKVSYQRGSTLLVTGVAFHGGRYAVASAKKGPYGVNLNDCTFDGYTQAGVRSSTGSITVTRSRFLAPRVPAFKMEDAVDQLVLVGNSFAARNVVTGCAANDPRIYRDDREKDVPAAMKYTFDHVPRRKPSASRVWDVAEFGAARGSYEEPPARDSTAAFQKALDAAGKARGGTVYVPAGIYRLDGALKVPHGVELRGCFSGAHYGNGTSAGTILWVYGGKDKPDAEPLVTLAPGSGFRGFTVFYPEQGWTDREGAEEEARVKKYPPTVRTASGCWVQDNTIVCCWDAIDAMTVKSDNLEIVDVTGAAMGSTLLYGHGAVDGVVRNLHFNYSNWTHQGKFPNRPHGGDDLTQYTGRCVKGLVLGDVRRSAFFSCFNILVSDQIVLERDRYTGRSFLGKTWGIAFDAAHNGVVGKAGCEAVIGLIASMGVFNQQGGGHYVVTEPGFKGHVVLSNADVWSGHSRIADIHGGTVWISQLLSWCCLEAVCYAGGELKVFASTYVGDHIGDNDPRDCIRYEAGAKGVVLGNVECRKRLTILTDPDAKVRVGVNGARKER